MSLQECRRQHTLLELRAWMIWLDKQWNRPTRSDHYSMRIAQTVAASRGASLPLDKFKVDFKEHVPREKVPHNQPQSTGVTRKQIVAMQKARWWNYVNQFRGSPDPDS